MSETQSGVYEQFRVFLDGGPKVRDFVTLNPSSFAAVFAGKDGGNPTIADEIRFHEAFPNDAMVGALVDHEELVPGLKWSRKKGKEENGCVFWEETLKVGGNTKRRIIAEKPGGIPWLVEAPVKSADDFDLINFYADCITENASSIAEQLRKYPPLMKEKFMIPGVVILSAFEAYWLIDYPDMPLFFMDFPEAYVGCIRNVHKANIALLEALRGVGFEIVFTGSAGLELLSPRIFRDGIVPFQREFNDHARHIGCYSSYHICGHSRELIETKIIDSIKPSIFETCSGPPCGTNENLREAVHGISEDIITKGNLSLELLAEGTPAQIREDVERIHEATRGRRHIIGQADATILPHTPHENIRAFLDAVKQLNGRGGNF